jgi:hypothetical protein
MEPLLTLLGGGLCLGLPIAVIVLWQRLNRLESRLDQLANQGTSSRNDAATPLNPVAAPSPLANVSPPPLVAPPLPPAQAVPIPPPLPPAYTAPTPPRARPVGPTTSTPPVVPAPATDPWSGLRQWGLLPPADLKGEFALGSWWAIRVAGLLALASVVFLAVWLNLRSTLPAWLRLAEIVALGAFGVWFGDRLARTRRDLGRVVFAVGLTVFQFAAWAAHGLERLRVLETPTEAAALQFIAALAVGAVALRREDRLIGQLAVGFAAVAGLLSVDAGATPLSIGLEAGSIAVLGGLLLARGGWIIAAALSLLSAVVLLVWLRLDRPDAPEIGFAGQLGATLAFLALWLADRFGPAAEKTPAGARNALLTAAFIAPATLAVWIADAGEDARALAAGMAALTAVAIGVSEFRRRRPAAELLLASALFFAASAVAWKLAPTLVWLSWMLAAALAQLLRVRTQIGLLGWASRLLTAIGIIAYLREAPTDLGICLLAPATVGALTAWRLRATTPDAALAGFGKVLDLLGLAVLTGFVQGHLELTQQAWAWVVVLPSALLFRQVELLWALAPAIFWTHVTVLRTAPNGEFAAGRGWMLGWALALAAGETWLIRLSERMEAWLAEWLRPFLAFIAALMLFKSLDLACVFPPNADDWRSPLLWFLGAVLTGGLAEFLRRATACPLSPLAAALAFWPGFLLLKAEGQDTAPTFAMAILWLSGQAVNLLGFARFRRSEAANASVWTGLYALLVGGTVFLVFNQSDRAEVSLLWALSAVTTFGLGRVLAIRAYEAVGVLGLLLATLLALTTTSSAQPYTYLALALLDAAMVWLLEPWDRPAIRVAQHVFAFMATAFGLVAAGKFLATHLAAGGHLAGLWLSGGALALAVSEALVRSTRRRSLGLAATLSILPSFLFITNGGGNPGSVTLATAPAWLVGLTLGLYAVARHSRETGRAGTAWRSLFGAVAGGLVLVMLDGLGGTQVSFCWALASSLVFALGLMLGTRTYRMLGLLGLLLATTHVILFDVQDLLGRIIACAAIAAAFFAVAWLYGRFVKRETAN